VAEYAAERISSSQQVKQQLGEVTVGLPISQSVASQNINGRVTKTVSLVLPVFRRGGGAGGTGPGAARSQHEHYAHEPCVCSLRAPVLGLTVKPRTSCCLWDGLLLTVLNVGGVG